MAAAAAAVAASTQRPLALLVYGATGFTGYVISSLSLSLYPSLHLFLPFDLYDVPTDRLPTLPPFLTLHH